ncbi:MAG: DUF1993 domain-containing protein [Hyphomicrobiales bacterium]|nr:DUF1993 domain-containing protein [Hyphomicrobiales bacterium]MBV9974196.1 DUF1993 domain-containing protein [Hyphomicrobiales bacterium]
MSLSMHESSVAVFKRMLGALSALLVKAETHAASRKIDPEALLGARLFPDMFSFTRQVQLTCDFAKLCCARLSGIEAPKHEDKEAAFPELKARIAATLAFIESVPANAIDGTENKDITLKIAGKDTQMKGRDYLLFFALPNFYFHATTAYDLLRHNGIEVGKRDFLGIT